MNRMTYQAALVQMDCGFLDVEGNLDKAESRIRDAVNHGAKTVCLPEAFNTGYLGSRIPDMKALAEKEDGKSLTRMRSLAKELGVYLIAPIIFQAESGVENTAFLIDDQGNILGHYSKSHPVGDEQKHFQRGKQYPVWDTPLGKIGIVICYDVCFPETVRLLALNGAEVVFVPAAWRASYTLKSGGISTSPAVPWTTWSIWRRSTVPAPPVRKSLPAKPSSWIRQARLWTPAASVRKPFFTVQSNRTVWDVKENSIRF